MELKEGMVVKAKTIITEAGGDTVGDHNAVFPNDNYIHADKDELGVVEFIEEDSGVPTVRWNRTGTATIVVEEEIECVK